MYNDFKDFYEDNCADIKSIIISLTDQSHSSSLLKKGTPILDIAVEWKRHIPITEPSEKYIKDCEIIQYSSHTMYWIPFHNFSELYSMFLFFEERATNSEYSVLKSKFYF